MPVETILLAVTDDEDLGPVTESVTDIATQTDATVVVGGTYDEEAYASTRDELNVSSPDGLARRDRDLEDVADRLEAAGVRHEVRGATGADGEGFVTLAEAVDADRVFVQGRERSPAGKALFGSVAQHVLLNAPCPVTFVRQ